VVEFQFAGTIDESDSSLVHIGDPFSGTFAYDLVNFGFPDNDPTRSVEACAPTSSSRETDSLPLPPALLRREQ
jgi:hypothetical protein